MAVRWACALVLIVLIAGCAAQTLKVDDSEKILTNNEFDQAVQVKEIAPDTPAVSLPPSLLPSGDFVLLTAMDPPLETGRKKKKTELEKVESDTNNIPLVKPEAVVDETKHYPELEDGEGFVGRRPLQDPFRAGEKVTLEMSYFGVVAGDLSLEVRPFVEVNGRKAYHFVTSIKSTSVFSVFYAVDDWAETFVDFLNLRPFSYALHVKESKQLRETRSFFDWNKLRAYDWDKRITKDSGAEERKEEWDILDWSQNVMSSPYYMRAFKLRPGSKISYRVAHEGKNLVVSGEVIRREKLSTPLGELATLVLKPNIQIGGVFQPIGEILFWMTDDDRKFIVRLESKIKIGKIVGQVKEIKRGAE